jgi:hypothetical protein
LLAIIVLLCLSALFILCLWLPAEIALRLDFGNGVSTRLLLSWLCGLIKRELRWESGAAVMNTVLRGGRPDKIVRAFAGARGVKGLPQAFFRLVKGCLKTLRLKEVVARLKIGLDSPADTALLLAYLSPLAFLRLFLGYDVDLQPSFSDDGILRGHVSAVVSLRPLQLALPVAVFLLSPPVIRAFASSFRKR